MASSRCSRSYSWSWRSGRLIAALAGFDTPMGFVRRGPRAGSIHFLRSSSGAAAVTALYLARSIREQALAARARERPPDRDCCRASPSARVPASSISRRLQRPLPLRVGADRLGQQLFR